MKTLVIAALMFFLWQPVQEQQQKPKPDSKQGQQLPSPSVPAATPIPSKPETTPQQNSSSGQPSESLCDRLADALISNWPLVGIGLLAIVVAWLTLRDIHTQAEATANATQAMRDSIPLQEKAANAASLNALAAKQAVEIVISRERCRISIKPWGRLHLPYRSDTANHDPIFHAAEPQGANYDIHFYGLTAGYISEAVAGACLSDSEDVPQVPPSLMRDLPKRVLATEQKELARTARLLPRFETIDDVIDVVEGRKFVHCWGFIRYRDAFYDAFHQERITSFRWVWKFTGDATDTPIPTPLGGRFGRWVEYGPPEDNRET
jgi:hypothetical protein